MAESISAFVQSTCLEEIFFNGETGDLSVTFTKGSRYTYSGVPAEVAQGLVNAASKGKYFRANILGSYGFRRG